MKVNAVPDEWNRSTSISFGNIERRLAGATLPERNAILDFVRSTPNRIRPALDDDWLYDSMSLYFLDCMALQKDSDADDDSIHSPFEAAHELVDWFNWIAVCDNDAKTIQKRVFQIATVFKNGNDRLQNCIETGFLEHVLETPRNRPYFSHWKDDEILAESYNEAIRWGKAHTKPNAP